MVPLHNRGRTGMESVTARSWLVPVTALLLAIFAVVSGELVITGLLPPVAADFGVDIPTAGLLITAYAVAVAIASPLLALLTAGISRRLLLIAVMVFFIVGDVLCAIAQDYWTLLAARILVATCHGLFFGIAIVLAARLAPPGRQATAVSLVLAGVNAATILGVPLGTAIGTAYGWRATFWVLAVVATIAALVLLWLIPKENREGVERPDFAAEFRAATRPAILICYLNIVFALLGIFAIVSYISPLLTEAHGIPIEYVPWVLFAMGICGFFGNLLAGRLGDWNGVVTMIGSLTLNVVILAALATLSGIGWPVVILLCAFQLIAFCFPAPVQTRILREAAAAPNLASTLISSAFNVGIAVGAAVGGAAIASGWSYGHLPWVTAIAMGCALLGTLGLLAYDRRRKAVPA
jgi:DHA1 family inner membrane transport protein